MSENLEPLYISTGKVADGENIFFPRDKIIRKIWRKLDRGEDLLLVAPRRIGKSSILHHIQKNPKKDYIVKYLSIMSTDSSNVYFKQIYKTLLEDNEIYGLAKSYFQSTRVNLKNWIKKIRGIGLEGIEIDKDEQINYFVETIELLQSLPEDSKTILFLLDEFPDTVSNIAKYSEDEAVNFLQENRDLRQQYQDINIQFILTGSIGLNNVVKKLVHEDIINDLIHIEIPFLTNEEALLMIDRLCLGLERDDICLKLDTTVKEYFLEKIVQNHPYYIMMIIDELGDEVADSEKEIGREDIDKVIDKIIKSNSNADYFSNWKTRLKDAFEKKEEIIAIRILSHISKYDTMSYEEMKKLDKKIDLKAIIEVLEYDGYISEQNSLYAFNSPLLKAWWEHRVAE